MSEEFDSGQYGLHRVHVQVLEGLVFLNLAREAPLEFDALYADYKPMLKFHGFSKAKIAHKENYPTAANWKLVVENFIECYHCASAHPQYCSVHPADQLLALGAGPGSGPEAAERAYAGKLKAWEDKALEMGHETILVSSDEHSSCFRMASRIPINDQGALSETRDGSPACKRLMGDFEAYDGGETALVFNPVSYILAFNDFALMFRFTPRGPLATDVELTWLVDEQSQSGVDYDVERLSEMWDITTRQDKTITENNQLGILSDRYQPGPYSQQEKMVDKYVRWYLRQLGS